MKLFVDLDGCLTDFDQAVADLGEEYTAGLADDAPEDVKQKMYDAIEKAGEDFWAKMKWTEDGKELWALVKKLNPTILSSPGKFQSAPAGKILWIQKNIPGTSLFLSDTKSEYIDPYDLSILIDDNRDNIGGWEQGGGEAILHTSAAETERKLLELLWATPEIDLNDYF